MPADPGHQFGFAGFVLDLSTRVVNRGGVPIPLRRKGFDLLAYLLEHRDRVVSKDELGREVWGGVAISDDALATTVRTIRSALGDDSRAQLVIRTVHGVGYQFVAPLEPIAEPHVAPPATPKPRSFRLIVSCAALMPLLAFGLFRLARESSGSSLLPRGNPAEALWLRFDEPGGEITTDSSGNGNHARLVNGIRRVPGVLGSALEFDGISGYLEGNSPGHGFPVGDSARSVVAWVRTSDHAPGDRNLLHWGTPVSDPPRLNFHLFLSDGRVGWGNGYGQGFIKSGVPINDGAWHQVAGVFTGPPADTSYVYVDTKQVETGGPLPASTERGSKWTVGLFMGGGTPFRGTLDDIRVFPGVISDSVLKALYNCAQPTAAFRAPFAGKPYFVPVGDAEVELGEKGASDISIPLENRKETLAAAQFASSDGVCKSSDLHGATLPAALRMTMDVELSAVGNPGGNMAGPFLNSPPLGPRDGLSKASGVWIAVDATGAVTARSLADHERILASGSPAATGSGGRARRLVVEARQHNLRAILDGTEVLRMVLPAGEPNTSAGVAFRIPDRPLYGVPQRIRNIAIEALE